MPKLETIPAEENALLEKPKTGLRRVVVAVKRPASPDARGERGHEQQKAARGTHALAPWWCSACAAMVHAAMMEPT